MSSQDPYTDPATGLLRNKLSITSAAELDRVEAEVTSLRLVQLRERDLPGDYDLAHLQAFHRFIFSDVYPWAGQLRTVAIAKDDLFCLPQHLEGFAADVFGRLARRDGYLRGLDRPEFLDKLTELLADINALHPFREGNGRAQRAFLAQLARDAGHPLRWEPMNPEQNVAASQAAHRGDNQPLRLMLDELVEVTPAETATPAEPAQDHPARTAGSSFTPPEGNRAVPGENDVAPETPSRSRHLGAPRNKTQDPATPARGRSEPNPTTRGDRAGTTSSLAPPSDREVSYRLEQPDPDAVLGLHEVEIASG
ncbi:Fic family protein [Pseudonocardia oroxyli]|uniref:protein adenylyltransferase n=1 Tax=Pseudonocardia oroxyli TaxID=366584 RepID=A0A1G8ERU6_PSEOR|nr:Fic family protein [Pseudonocardia oroxyli]SDH72590.1 Fido, protein-threonine AMPylation domain-containing protein [Pseudonocardia oroxyli]